MIRYLAGVDTAAVHCSPTVDANGTIPREPSHVAVMSALMTEGFGATLVKPMTTISLHVVGM